ncbi:MAG: acyl--CoA ligase [Pirellulales bacterium]|nr:acyl--CoA ligase [Pirellulales bacterium]
MRATLVHHFLEQAAQAHPESILVIDGETRASYKEVDSEANRVAHALLEQGIKTGDRVGLLASNSRFYIESYYGILKAGAIVVALNAAADWRTHCEFLEHSQARGLICGARMGRRVVGIEQLSHLEFILGTTADWPDKFSRRTCCRFLDSDGYLAAKENHRPHVSLSKNDRAAIVYTSGSTGRPKGVTLQHRNLVANTCSIVEYLKLTAADRVLVVLPFHYVYGKSLLNTHVAVGGSVVIENRFLFLQQALDTLEQTAATGLAGVPSTFAILLNRSNFCSRIFPHLRYLTQAGGAMAPDLQRRLIECLPGKQIFIMYGATEASARLAYLNPADLPRKIGSIGKAIPNVEIRVLREDGTEAGVDEVGELVARGENIMEGYWNNPEETAAVLSPLGYHTGDLGRRDKEGFLYVVGRNREMIKSGAHRISPKEIEEVLAEHPQVHEAAVIGVPDEILGEAIWAFISPRLNEMPNAEDLLHWCKKRLPSYKVPGTLQVLRELQRNASGKIDKLLLVREYSRGRVSHLIGQNMLSSIQECTIPTDQTASGFTPGLFG